MDACLKECCVLKLLCHVLRKSSEVHYVFVLIYQMGLRHQLNFPRGPLNRINIQMFQQTESSSYALNIACFHLPAPEQSRAEYSQLLRFRSLQKTLQGCIFINLPRLWPRSLFLLYWLGSPNYISCHLIPGDITCSSDPSPVFEGGN